MDTKGIFPVDKFSTLQTPFYYYDTHLLRKTLEIVRNEANRYNYHIHYAVKANANDRVLSIIRENGLGADCVSGGEINAALKAGFPANQIVFAGVGKADWEINLGLDHDIFCFNVESAAELEVIDELAGARGKVARVALRVNPEVDARTHHYITTGLKENKFGINLSQLDSVVDLLMTLKNVELIGLHFHIGSQITDLESFQGLCARMEEIQQDFDKRRITLANINFGGGLGIDYEHPNRKAIPDFKEYFAIFNKHFNVRAGQQIHFEPGRSVVGQCGSLITRVLYVKEGTSKKFAIVDAGFTELIRPALYQAFHKIENLSSDAPTQPYDVVGPICESSDSFGKAIELNEVKRGDLFALRSAGAYGEIMASQYNCRTLPKAYFTEDLI